MSAVLVTQQVNAASWLGGGGNLNKLKNLEGKPRRQRVWKPDPARELNTTRMLGLRNSRERWPLNPEQGWLSDGGYWRTVNLPRSRGRKKEVFSPTSAEVGSAMRMKKVDEVLGLTQSTTKAGR